MPLCEDCGVWSATSPPGRNFCNAPAPAFVFVFVLATIHRLAHWLDAGFDPRCIRHGEQFHALFVDCCLQRHGQPADGVFESNATPGFQAGNRSVFTLQITNTMTGAYVHAAGQAGPRAERERQRRGADQHQLLVDHCCDCLSAISFSADAPHPEREWRDCDVAAPGSHTDRTSQAALIPAVE